MDLPLLYALLQGVVVLDVVSGINHTLEGKWCKWLYHMKVISIETTLIKFDEY